MHNLASNHGQSQHAACETDAVSKRMIVESTQCFHAVASQMHEHAQSTCAEHSQHQFSLCCVTHSSGAEESKQSPQGSATQALLSANVTTLPHCATCTACSGCTDGTSQLTSIRGQSQHQLHGDYQATWPCPVAWGELQSVWQRHWKTENHFFSSLGSSLSLVSAS